jgi:hypothetical protein
MCMKIGLTLRKVQTEGLWEQGAEAYIWNYEGESGTTLGKTV